MAEMNVERDVNKDLELEENAMEGVKSNGILPSKASKQSQMSCLEKAVGLAKRKRASVDGCVNSLDKGSLLTECHRELDCLFEFYKELSVQSLNLEESGHSSNNSLIASILEESNLSFSKLVELIYEKLRGKEGVTLAYVQSSVLSIGQRMMYGIANAYTDVLEDESESCLWCWETRDLKLLPANKRGDLTAQRVGRKKISERIAALSATLSALAVPEHQDNYKGDLKKASMKLGKTLNLEEICSLVKKKRQKDDTIMAAKSNKLREKESTCEIQKEKLRNDKEIRKLHEVAEKEEKRRLKEESELKKQLKKQQEEAEKEEKRRLKEEAELKKQVKKQQEEAEKEEKCRLKEEAELKKQLKRQQEEAERDQSRRKKEAAELKQHRSLKKQATIMERFLKTTKSNNHTNSHSVENPIFMKDPTCESPGKVEDINATTSLMDNAFSRQDKLGSEDLRKLHVDSWHKLFRWNRSCRWGVRRIPKVELVKEIKLHESSTDKDVASFKDCREPNLNKPLDGPEKLLVNDNTDIAPSSVPLLRKKLLQFDKSNRPAYYGTWSKKSCEVGPRHPFRKDPGLDYDVDSDEEWEEEEPGESLSDCEKDTEEELLEGENSKGDDEEETEDGFFVPDGYLSENEGVQVDSKSDGTNVDLKSYLGCESEFVSEEIRALLQKQKYLQNMTEQALRKGHLLIISNLSHEKSEIVMVEDMSGTCKIDQMCLQALSMQAFPGNCSINISLSYCLEKEDQEVLQPDNKSNIPQTPITAATSELDLAEFVSSIRSNSQGISKVLDSLQAKFPTISKTHLRNKVREISDYVDSRWQVKTEILYKLGLSKSPVNRKRKGIATFFSKRCLPPEDSISVTDSSPHPPSKNKVLQEDETQCLN